MKKLLMLMLATLSLGLQAQKPSYSGMGGLASVPPHTIQTISTNATITEWNRLVLNVSPNTTSITLPPALATDVGKQIWVKAVNVGMAFVAVSGSDQFYTQYASVFSGETRIFEVTAVGVVHEITTMDRQYLSRGNALANYAFTASETRQADVITLEQNTANVVVTLTPPLGSPNKILTVINRNTSTTPVRVQNVDIGVGQSQTYHFDGAAWKAVGTEKQASYLYARLTATSASIGAVQDVSGYVLAAGDIITNGTNFSLEAGKTYQLSARFQAAGWSGTSPFATIQWVDAATNTPLIQNGGMAMVLPPSATNSPTPIPTAEIVYTPSANQAVKLRIVGRAGTFSLFAATNGSNIGATDVTILQVGSSPLVRDSRVVVIATNSSGQSIPSNATTQITGWTEATDTHGAFAGSTFVAPKTAYYLINFALNYASFVPTAAGVVSAEITGTVNRATYSPVIVNVPLDNCTPIVSSVVYLQQGQSIGVASYQTTGAARALNNSNVRTHLSITEVTATY